MIIRLLKNNGFITGFISHIKHPHEHPKKELREIPDSDYKILFYYLVGREHVKEKKGGVNIGGLELKDEGDHNQKHEKIQKNVFKHKFNHLLK